MGAAEDNPSFISPERLTARALEIEAGGVHEHDIERPGFRSEVQRA